MQRVNTSKFIIFALPILWIAAAFCLSENHSGRTVDSRTPHFIESVSDTKCVDIAHLIVCTESEPSYVADELVRFWVTQVMPLPGIWLNAVPLDEKGSDQSRVDSHFQIISYQQFITSL